jgi:hypothetical protein
MTEAVAPFTVFAIIFTSSYTAITTVALWWQILTTDYSSAFWLVLFIWKLLELDCTSNTF